MKPEQQTAISLKYNEHVLSHEDAQSWVRELSITGLEVSSNEEELKPYASLDWAIPTAIAVYLSKPYFEAFLSEAGKDHYKFLKSGFIQLASKIFGSKSEIRQKRRFSKILSIHSQTNGIETIKFTIPEGLSIEEYEQLFDEFHSLMVSEFSVDKDGHLAEILSNNQLPARTYYLEYLPEEKVWINIDMLAEAVKAHENQNK